MNVQRQFKLMEERQERRLILIQRRFQERLRIGFKLETAVRELNREVDDERRRRDCEAAFVLETGLHDFAAFDAIPMPSTAKH